MGLWVQQWVLRQVNLLLLRHHLAVHFVFVPSFLQPADRVSRLEELCGGSRSQAHEAAGAIWRRLGDNVSGTGGSMAEGVGGGRGWGCGAVWSFVGFGASGEGGVYVLRRGQGGLGLGTGEASRALWKVWWRGPTRMTVGIGSLIARGVGWGSDGEQGQGKMCTGNSAPL